MFGGALSSASLDRPPSSVVARLIVPGWAQIYLGQKTRGRLFLGVYGVFIVLTLAFLGTNLGSVLLGLAIAVHGASVIDIVLTGMSPGPSAFLHCLFYGGMVAVFVYWPVMFAFSRLAVPLQVLIATGSLEPGDIVLCDPSAYRWSSPRPGDVVIYNMNSVQFPGRMQGHRNVIYSFGGREIDRILAGPGQSATAVDGDLRIDGDPDSPKPLNEAIRFAPITLTVPPDHYLIVPSGVTLLGSLVPAQLMNQAALVPSRAIEGKIYFRKYPFGRIGVIR
jgi:hypothetical protein